MKKLIILASIILSSMTTNAQKIVMSDTRPDIPITVAELPSEVDTVMLLLETGFEEGVRVTPKYKILYEKLGKYEGKTLCGLPNFFVKDETGYYAKPIKPIAFYVPEIQIWGPYIEKALLIEPNSMFITYPSPSHIMGSDLVDDRLIIRRQ